jgi:hypothetical protein
MWMPGKHSYVRYRHMLIGINSGRKNYYTLNYGFPQLNTSVCANVCSADLMCTAHVNTFFYNSFTHLFSNTFISPDYSPIY